MHDDLAIKPARRDIRADGGSQGAHLLAGLGTTILFVVGIAGGSLVGWSAPSIGDALEGMVDHTVLLLVSLLIFEVNVSSIARSWAELRFLSIAWVTNFVLVPTIGFGIASLFLSGQPLFFIGLVIYFMAPCTDWFLGYTRLAEGNTALGAALLPINMITQLLLYPVYLQLFAGGVAPLSAGVVGASLLQWFCLPFAVAIAAHQVLRRILPASVFSRVLSWAGRAVPFVIAALVVEIFAAHIEVILANAPVFATMLLAICLFFVATFILGEIVSRLAGFAYPEHALLTMTTAARNAPMMLVVTMIALPDQPLVYAAIIIGMLVEFPHLTALRQILLRGRQSDPTGPALQHGLPRSRPSAKLET